MKWLRKLLRIKKRKWAVSTMMHQKLDEYEVKYAHTIHYVVSETESDAKEKAVEMAFQIQPDFEISNVICLDITDKV